MALHWHLIHTKPRQERSALLNLEQQGVTSYLPIRPTEALVRDTVVVRGEPLFPRYLFIQLDDAAPAVSWSALRCTRGVSRLVFFGTQPARVDPGLVDHLRAREAASFGEPARLFGPGHRVRLAVGAFAGLEGIYQMAEGERRAMVLIELLSRSLSVTVPVANLRRTG